MIEEGRFDNNPRYWIPKLMRTVERDKQTSKTLEFEGWKVVRFWESEIINSPKVAAECVYRIVNERKVRKK